MPILGVIDLELGRRVYRCPMYVSVLFPPMYESVLFPFSLSFFSECRHIEDEREGTVKSTNAVVVVPCPLLWSWFRVVLFVSHSNMTHSEMFLLLNASIYLEVRCEL